VIARRAARAVLAACLVALATAIGAPGTAGAASDGAPYARGDRVDVAGLVTQHGVPFRFDDGSGRVVAFAFVYTSCRDADGCPATTAQFVKVRTRLDSRRVRLALVTIAPEHDTPAVLRRYAAAFGTAASRLDFVTGDPHAVATLTGRFGILGAERDPDGALDHAERTIVLDGHARVADRIEGALWAPDDAAVVIDDVAGLAHDPLRELVVHLAWAVEHRCGVPDTGVGTSLHHAAAALVLALPPGPLAALLLWERRRTRRKR
jgi:cytochrome oxidase Cu insertion factor (SCO1/SenC/PrrC family)